jgi:hypothetical protein
MNFGQRWQERGGPQDVAHRIELDDEDALLDRLVVIARAEHSRPLMPHTRAIAQKEAAVPGNLAGGNRQVHGDSVWRMPGSTRRRSG